MPINFNQENNMQKPIVIHGPQGCGKTRHAAVLAAHFGASRVVDDWNGRDALQPGDLALTNCFESVLPGWVWAMSFEQAMRLVAIAMNNEKAPDHVVQEMADLRRVVEAGEPEKSFVRRSADGSGGGGSVWLEPKLLPSQVLARMAASLRRIVPPRSCERAMRAQQAAGRGRGRPDLRSRLAEIGRLHLRRATPVRPSHAR